MAKWVYMFTEGNADMRNLLGGKGANLAEMTNLGLPVPQGFTITTEACTQYYEDGRKINDEIMDQIMEAIEKMEGITGKKFGDKENPLLVYVRSGARASMPGMMDTILNLGLNDDVVEVLAKKSGNPRWAWDCYRRFIQMFSDVEQMLDTVSVKPLSGHKIYFVHRADQMNAQAQNKLLKTLGYGGARILVRHTLPNVMDVAIAKFVPSVASCIMVEATLSFLGMGSVTDITWGVMIQNAFEYGGITMGKYAWIIAPVACIVLLQLSAYLISQYVDFRRKIVQESTLKCKE